MPAKKQTPAKKSGAAKKKSAGKQIAKTKKPAGKKLKTPLTKTQLCTTVSEETGLTKKEVASVLDSLSDIIESHVNKSGPKSFTLPGLLKINIVHKKATKARKGINPFTGEETVFKAKPARNVVKVRALKRLKEAANH